MLTVQISRKPLKFLNKLPENYRKVIKEKLGELENDPRPRGAIHLTGKENCFRIRIGPFRIQYQLIENDNIVLVYKISRRDEKTYSICS